MQNANSHATSAPHGQLGQDETWLDQAVAASGEGWALVSASGRVEAVAGPAFALLDTPRPQALAGARLREILRALRSDEPLQWPPATGPVGWHWTARRQDGRDIRIDAHGLSRGDEAEAAWALRIRWATHVAQAAASAGGAGALYHPATRLPQQPLLIDRLQQAVERSQRTVTQRFAVVLANLAVLETLERESLRAVARQLEDAIRPADTVAHLDHETLAIIMEPVRGDDATVQVAIDSMVENLRRALDDLPGDRALGKDVVFSVALGDGGSHPSDLLALARTRLVRRTISLGGGAARPVGPGAAPGVDPAHRAPAVDLAIDHEFDLQTGLAAATTLHFAALPSADDLIAILADRAVGSAASDGGTGDGLHLVIAVDRMPHVDALPRLLHLIQTWRPDATLTLELDEAAIAHDPEAAIQFIDAAARREVGIGIGRFGINQCTDSLIARLPLNRLTLDPDLVTEARNAAQARIRLAATIAWAHDRGLAVVATGIGDRALATLVTQLGCDFARGPAFGA